MGWDAFAEPVERIYAWRDGRNGLRDPEHDAAFEVASHWVTENAGGVDGLLRQAGLDVSDCALALEDATGESCWPDGHEDSDIDWTPDKVRELARNAQWTEFSEDVDLWAQLSAKMFLETCARLGLGVRFSW